MLQQPIFLLSLWPDQIFSRMILEHTFWMLLINMEGERYMSTLLLKVCNVRNLFFWYLIFQILILLFVSHENSHPPCNSNSEWTLRKSILINNLKMCHFGFLFVVLFTESYVSTSVVVGGVLGGLLFLAVCAIGFLSYKYFSGFLIFTYSVISLPNRTRKF